MKKYIHNNLKRFPKKLSMFFMIVTILFLIAFSLPIQYAEKISLSIEFVYAETNKAPTLDYSGFVDCDGVVKTGKDAEPFRDKTCDFTALMRTINKIINWMFVISIPVATVLFAYAGLLYIRGTPGTRTKANNIFTTVGIGFIIMLVAWLSVRTVVDWFVESNSGATTFLGK